MSTEEETKAVSSTSDEMITAKVSQAIANEASGFLRTYHGDDKKNLECRFYEQQVSI